MSAIEGRQFDDFRVRRALGELQLEQAVVVQLKNQTRSTIIVLAIGFQKDQKCQKSRVKKICFHFDEKNGEHIYCLVFQI